MSGYSAVFNSDRFFLRWRRVSAIPRKTVGLPFIDLLKSIPRYDLPFSSIKEEAHHLIILHSESVHKLVSVVRFQISLTTEIFVSFPTICACVYVGFCTRARVCVRCTFLPGCFPRGDFLLTPKRAGLIATFRHTPCCHLPIVVFFCAFFWNVCEK